MRRVLVVLMVTGCASSPKDRCESVECNQPPLSQCTDLETLRQYQPTGSCDTESGECTYSHTDSDCPHGCRDGACLSEDKRHPITEADIRKAVRSFVKGNWESLPEPDGFPEVLMEKTALPKKARKRFLRSYGAFHKEYALISDELRHLGPALVALNRVHRSSLPEKGGDRP